MERPFKFEIRCKKTGKSTFQNHPPLTLELETCEPTENPKVFKRVQTKVCYIDTRYEAKKRLWEYLHPEFKRRPIYEGTEIGKTIPILNF